MRHAPGCVLALALSILTAAPAAAQIVSVPSFEVAMVPAQTTVDVAVGADGTLLFAWTRVAAGIREVYVRRFTAAGVALGPATRIDQVADTFVTSIAGRAGGGFLAAWMHVGGDGFFHLFGVDLDAGGVPTGPDGRADGASFGMLQGSAAVLPAGSVFVWTRIKSGLTPTYEVMGRLFDAADQPLGAQFSIGSDGFDGRDVAATADGGFAVSWQDHPNQIGTMVRTFDAAGTPRGPQQVVGLYVGAERIAGHPAGGGAVIGGNGGSGNGVTLVGFAPDGAPVGTTRYISSSGSGPDLEFAADGRLFIAYTQLASVEEGIRPRVQVLSPTYEPLFPPFWIAAENATRMRTARLLDGESFVVAWSTNTTIHGAVVRLCPSDHCGNGVVEDGCAELCDDGAANNDTVPDACRTDCRLAGCTDGVLDADEECDDGNPDNCDGCDAICGVEIGLGCGDGIPYPTCDEPCDDANLVDGDGCTSACAPERAFGGGAPRRDCYAEWQIDNTANTPRFVDASINHDQRCVDDDPACDFDGGTTGSCMFHVAVCGNNTNITGCNPAPRLAAWQLVKPSVSQAAHVPAYASVRAALLGTVPGAIVGPTTTDICSPFAAIPVPLRGEPGTWSPGRLKLKANAIDYYQGRDSDALKLTCLPTSP